MDGHAREGGVEAGEPAAPGGQKRIDARVGEGDRMMRAPPGQQPLPLLAGARHARGRRRRTGREGRMQAGDLVGEGGREPRVPVGGAQGPTGHVGGHHVGGAQRVVGSGLQGDGAGAELGRHAPEDLELGLHGAGHLMGRTARNAQDPGLVAGADPTGRVALTGPKECDLRRPRFGWQPAQPAGVNGGPDASRENVVRWEQAAHSPVPHHLAPSARRRPMMARAASTAVSRAVSRRRSASGQGA